MTKRFRTGLAVAFLLLAAPLASYAQSGATPEQCAAAGLTYVEIDGVGYCTATNPSGSSAPEISASASIGGVALLLCGIVMLRGRKRSTEVELAS